MSYLIAITGKGGVGKTTIAALFITRLIKKGCKPVLAVDADPNMCLDASLGITVEKTIGRVREEAREAAGKGMVSGVSKHQLLEMRIAESLVEAEDFDLIAMGRPEGPGCYCYANNVLKSALNEIASNYPYVVIDNEAGLENLSRRIVQNINLLVIITDPSHRGFDTVQRLYQLAMEMDISYDNLAIVVNRLRHSELAEHIDKLRLTTQADYIVTLPNDDEILNASENGISLFGLSECNNVIQEVDKFVMEIGLG